MANGRNSGKGPARYRDQGRFLALPFSVIDSDAYRNLSHPARSLLVEIDRQYGFDNNGRLLASYAYLRKRGWTSADTITRAKRELLAAGFIHETVKGCRPNKASWYAVTWRSLDRLKGYDEGAVESFVRSAYVKNVPLKPIGGQGGRLIGPCRSLGVPTVRPSEGAIGGRLAMSPEPQDGNHLDMPSDDVLDRCSK